MFLAFRQKSDKNCNWRQQNEEKIRIRFYSNCPWRHLPRPPIFKECNYFSRQKLKNKHYAFLLFVCARMFCVITRLGRDRRGATVMRLKETQLLHQTHPTSGSFLLCYIAALRVVISAQGTF